MRFIAKIVKNTKGAAAVEFAVTAPILIILSLGVFDYGRLFYHAVALHEAAAEAAFYGAIDNSATADTDTTEGHGQDSTGNISSGGEVTVESQYFCDCPDNPADGPDSPNAVSCTTGVCPGYGAVRLFVMTSTDQAFEPFLSATGLVDMFNVGDTVFMRVQ